MKQLDYKQNGHSTLYKDKSLKFDFYEEIKINIEQNWLHHIGGAFHNTPSSHAAPYQS